MTYYGVTMYAGNLGGDFFLNFFLLAVVEFPAKAFSISFLDRMGRKWLHFLYMVLGGSACIGTIFTVLYGGEGMYSLGHVARKPVFAGGGGGLRTTNA